MHAGLCTLACSVFHACAGIGRSDRYASRGCFARCGAQDPFLCLSGISVKVCLSPAHLPMTSPTHPSPPHPQPMLKSIYPLTCASNVLPQDLYIPPPTQPPNSSSHGPSCTLQPCFILHPSPTPLSIYPSITHPPIHLSSHPLTHLPTHPCMHSPKHPKPTHPSTHSSIVHPHYTDLSTYHLTIHPPFHKSIHSSIHSLIHLLPIRSFTSSIYSIHSMYPFCSPPTPSFFFTPV